MQFSTHFKNEIINAKYYAQYDKRYRINSALKEDMTLPGCNLIEEESKDKELVYMKEALQNGNASQSVNSKYIILDDILYYLSKADADLVIRLVIIADS